MVSRWLEKTVACVYAGSGLLKVTDHYLDGEAWERYGVPVTEDVNSWRCWGLPPWFRRFSGGLQLATAGLMLVPAARGLAVFGSSVSVGGAYGAYLFLEARSPAERDIAAHLAINTGLALATVHMSPGAFGPVFGMGLGTGMAVEGWKYVPSPVAALLSPPSEAQAAGNTRGAAA
eukprot:TRINITY_DN69584_c0_g1_i1.p1 TRINITY_DN69584_c0_g1~~TRINITY_DN69584_c0_g1_i1.p1  ORF type:complete len:175 (+),score=26.62 TRINITY_DN69584_c0_g1_i1:91-615(+)